MRLITQLTPERTKRYLLPEGKNFETHKGKISFEQIENLWEGATFELGKDKFLISRPSLTDYIMLGLKRKTQIIYPSDIAQLISLSWISGDEKIFESWVGSGALSLGILNSLKNWSLTSIEAKPEFASLAEQNIQRWAQFKNLKFNHQIIVSEFNQADLKPNSFDIWFLDMKEADQNLKITYNLLKPWGTLLIWVPTTNQVSSVLEKAKPYFFVDKVVNLQLTEWIRVWARLRPEDFQVWSRGWAIKLIKLK